MICEQRRAEEEQLQRSLKSFTLSLTQHQQAAHRTLLSACAGTLTYFLRFQPVHGRCWSGRMCRAGRLVSRELSHCVGGIGGGKNPSHSPKLKSFVVGEIERRKPENHPIGPTLLLQSNRGPAPEMFN